MCERTRDIGFRRQPAVVGRFCAAVGAREDAFAEPAHRYGTFHDAFRCLLADTSFDVPAELQGDLFEEDGDVN